MVAMIPIYAPVKLPHREKVHQLGKYQASCIHRPFPPDDFWGLWPKNGFQVDINLFVGISLLFMMVRSHDHNFNRTPVMFYKDHMPPHFHAKYAGQWASFSIEELKIVEGSLPRRAISLVLEWAFQHRDELMANWEKAQRKESLEKIDPLD